MNPFGSIEHRGLAYHYTAYIYKGDEPPGQSITEVLNTTTLHIYIREMNPP